MKNSEHSDNFKILKILRREYNKILFEIKKEKEILSKIYSTKISNEENCYTRDNIISKHNLLLLKKKKEINEISQLIKTQKLNICISIKEFCC